MNLFEQNWLIWALSLSMTSGVLWYVLVWFKQRRLVVGLGLDDEIVDIYATRALAFGASGLLLVLAGVEVFLCLFTLLVAFGGMISYYYRLGEQDTFAPIREVFSFCREYAVVLTVIFVVRNFVVQHYQVPTGSLEPTVRPGDFILVNQFAYGWHLPIFNTKLIPYDEPKRGDIVVFRYPEDPYKIIYVKRCIGLPGDHIVYHNKTLTINGQAVEQKYLGAKNVGFLSDPQYESRRTEYFPGVTHDILVRDGDYAYDKDEVDLIVPPGHYFMLGDNRDNSYDSRFWGPVAEKYIVGKAMLILLSWDWGTSSYLPTFSRSGLWL